jgi:protein required for attachment to host cells
MITWILVCDASRALLFSTIDKDRSLQFQNTIENPKGRLRDSELRSDKPGRVRSRGDASAVSAIDSHTEAQEVEAQRFARTLGQYLTDAKNRNEFEKLHLVAPPHFLGLLRNELNPKVSERIGQTFNKDFIHFDKIEVEKRLEALLGG